MFSKCIVVNTPLVSFESANKLLNETTEVVGTLNVFTRPPSQPLVEFILILLTILTQTFLLVGLSVFVSEVRAKSRDRGVVR